MYQSMKKYKLILIFYLVLISIIFLSLPIKARSVNLPNLNVVNQDTYILKQTLPIRKEIFSQTQQENKKASNTIVIPRSPRTGTAKGNIRPGATKAPPSCLKPDEKLILTALVKKEANDVTLFIYPHFWFYIDIPSQCDNLKVQFTLKKPTKLLKNDQFVYDYQYVIYNNDIPVTSNSDFLKVSIPKEVKYALKEKNVPYKWDLRLVEYNGVAIKKFTSIYGFIQNVGIRSPQEYEELLKGLSAQVRYKVYIDNDLWFDGINELAQEYVNNPQNSLIKQKWAELLKLIGFMEINN
jgi:hypothetical protein